MNTIILLLFGIIIGILAIVIVCVCYYYAVLVRKLSKTQKENVYLRFHVQEKSLGKINEARSKALKIVQDATLQAEELLKKTQFIQTDTTDAFQKQLAELTNKQKEALVQASQELTTSFDETIKQLEEDDINIFKNTSKELEVSALEEVDSFRKQLAENTVDSQKVIDDKVQEAFHHALEEVEVYKTKRIQTIDNELFRILSDVTKEIIGKRLTFDDQKELLKHSLEKVKEEIDAIV
jgi:hypothetical protein